MVILTLSKKLNQWIGPVILRYGIHIRYRLGKGVIADNPLLDSILLLPLAQKIISLEVYEESNLSIRKELDRRAALMKTTKNDSTFSDDPSLHVEFNESDIRLKVLEQYLRPALLPTERWGDVTRWQFNKQIVKWVRKEYLVARYGSDVRSAISDTSLCQSPQIASTSLSRKNRGTVVNLLLYGKLPFDSSSDKSSTGNFTKRRSPLDKLPTSKQVLHAFAMQDWSIEKNVNDIYTDMQRIVTTQLDGKMLQVRGRDICFAVVPDSSRVTTNLSLEDIVEVAGGHITQCGPFNALCETANIYQFWTREYIEQLGSYLQQKTDSFPGETVILDVGAGDGILSQCLREYFEDYTNRQTSGIQEPNVVRSTATAKSSKKRGMMPQRLKQNSLLRRQQQPPVSTSLTSKTPSILASDDKSWNIKEKAEVLRSSVQATLDRANSTEHRKQIICLCSWMPMYEDWTQLFRQANVDEYILIGECDDGQCGDNWKTWGNRHFQSNDIEIVELDDTKEVSGDVDSNRSSNEHAETIGSEATERSVPPYELDGYSRNDLEFLSPYQFSRFDCRVSKTGRTVSFQRKQEP